MRVDGTFPVQERELPELVERLTSKLLTATAAIRHPEGDSFVTLKTDSIHLHSMFRKNWAKAPSDMKPDSTIIALRRQAEDYGFTTDMNHVRSYCRATRTILYFQQESYANLKISVRGLLSQSPPGTIAWFHGCSMRLRFHDHSFGLLAIGRSGAGKPPSRQQSNAASATTCS